ncbi:MAG: alpha/beta hydrolase fold protein [Lentisphaerae bacterium ADurb.BinA184]|nr:MAG: alpha/beta hydrolase fold protein [Lentisphaerae bacterium ADurb.BinA184]
MRSLAVATLSKEACFAVGLATLMTVIGTPAEEPRPARPFRLLNHYEFAAQDWPLKPGARRVRMHVEKPSGGISADTGLMLVLHNWGGLCDQPIYQEWCRLFAERYNVIAMSVNYLQSAGEKPELPYDHGYLQAMDGLRAIHHIRHVLAEAEIAYNPRRCYAMGVSGGGNVALMVNKFAPRTFACVVDICGMPGLTDAIAYGLTEHGAHLNAGYSRDPASPAYLAAHMQAIRDPGHPGHLAIQHTANPANKVVIVHGQDDASCSVVHKIGIFKNMVEAGLRPDGHFLTAWHVDGAAVKDTTHSIGGREKIVFRFADDYLLPDGRLALATPGPDDFERGQDVVYPVTGGRYVIEYAHGPPTIRFEETKP